MSAILDILLPRRCAVCGRKLLRNEDILCTDCARGMPLTYFWLREHNPMADVLNAGIQKYLDGESVPRCENYAYAVALYFYKEGYKNLSRSLKYEARVGVGRYVAEALGRKILLSPYLSDVDVIVPVPLHWTRRLRRGYNQAEIIAESVSKVLSGDGRNVKVMPSLLRRIRRTKTQVHLGMKYKAANVAGAFEARISCEPVHVLLVDDVFTSGSTLAECHRALRKGLIDSLGPDRGAAVKISVATLAFVGD